MNLLAMVVAAQEGEGGGIFSLAPGVSFWTVVIFLTLLWVLAKYAFPPILGYAEAREKRIQDSLDEARRTRDEAKELLEQQRRELAESRQEALRIVAEGKQAAETMREQILAEARAQQEEVLERARAEIRRERELAVEELRREAVDLALAAAGRLVEERMDAPRDRAIVERFLQEAGTLGDGAGAAK